MSKLILKSLSVLFLIAPIYGFAQETSSPVTEVKTEAAEEVKPVSSNERVEKLEVTGSHIRRTDIEGPSPVLVIDRDQIEKSGFTSVGNILRNTTVAPFGGNGSSVSLKGIGSGRTLVLINGQRAPASGSSYASGSVSANFVPIAAVERIEVLKDGASATYGSDALGGVVNIITRKDLDGFSFANRYDLTNVNGGDSNLLSFAYGNSTSDSNLMTSLQFRYVQGARSSDQDVLKELNRSIPFSTNYQADPPNPNYFPGPNCEDLKDGLCQELISPQQISKPFYGLDWVTDYSTKVSEGVTLYSTLIAGYKRDESSFPNVLNTPGDTLGVLFTGAESPAAWNTLTGYNGTDDIRVFHRMDELQNVSVDNNYYAALILGTKGYWGNSDWEWDVTTNNQVNIAESHEKDLALLSGTKAAIISGQYDPFDLGTRDTSGMAIDAMNRNRMVVNWVEAKTNGELGQLLGFDWASAFGVSGAHFEYADHRAAAILAGDVMMQSGTAGKGARELYSLFSEFSGMIGNSFELQFSLRGDFYSDFGETINPKVALRYQPKKWLTFRSSMGTGFQAPTLQNMNARIEGYDFLVDQVRCKDPSIGNSNPNHSTCRTQTVSINQDVNSNLKEETSLSYNVGAVVQPTKNFSMSVDWWYVKVEDTIGTDLNDILFLENLNASLPAKYGVTVNRDGGSATGQINRITYQLQNVGTEEVNGVDLELNYNMPTTIGKFKFNNTTTYLGHYYSSFYEELGKEQVVGQFQKPRWRNVATVEYGVDNFSVRAVGRSFARTEKRVRGLGSIESVTQYDLIFSYDPSWAGRFQLGAINLFNIRPQFDDTYSRKINEQAFRRFETYYLTYRQDF